MIVPDIAASHVQAFCDEISVNDLPRYVPLCPFDGFPERCCFDIVDVCIAVSGGRKIIGWAIWEWPSIFIEAELHCVWLSPDGEFFDPTPRAEDHQQILFLPDPYQPEPDEPVDNRRKSLSSDPICSAWILSAERHHSAKGLTKMAHAICAGTLWQILQAKAWMRKTRLSHGA